MSVSTSFRPLLAATIESDEDLLLLEYPLIASPKIDGIRVLCHPTYGPCTRSLKPVPNEHIRRLLSHESLYGLDGEVVVGPLTSKDVFNRTVSAVMTQSGEPNFTYYVFDHFTDNQHPYSGRLIIMDALLDGEVGNPPPYVQALEFTHLRSPEAVLYYELEALKRGYEGIMLRHRSGPYKWGRSTLKQQTLMKLKRFADVECKVVGFEPLLRNTNPQTLDNLGLAERSSHKAGKVAAETLGNLLVFHAGGFGNFSVGSGFDQALRDKIWNDRPNYLNRYCTIKYQKCGIVEKPRFPIFKGFRPQE